MLQYSLVPWLLPPRFEPRVESLPLCNGALVLELAPLCLQTNSGRIQHQAVQDTC